MKASRLSVLALLPLLALTACGSSGPSAEDRAAVAALRAEVLYEVEGTAINANVTMASPSGTEQRGISVPMYTKSTGAPGLRVNFPLGEFVYISAQNQDSRGYITCRITVDGVVISENTSNSDYGIATCEGTT